MSELYAIAEAVDDLAHAFDAMTATDVAGRLSCGEAEALAHLFHVAGHDDRADEWLSAHIASDTDLTCDEVREIHGTCPCVAMDATCNTEEN